MINFQTFLVIIIITMYLHGLMSCYVGYKKAKFWYEKDKMYGIRLGFRIFLVGLLLFISCLIFTPIIKDTITVLIAAVGSLIIGVIFAKVTYLFDKL